jgi:hypothetical protein
VTVQEARDLVSYLRSLTGEAAASSPRDDRGRSGGHGAPGGHVMPGEKLPGH